MRAETGEKALKNAPLQGPESLKRIKMDTWIGMGFSNVVAFFIILTTAATLNLHGIVNIQTSSEAAEALKPIAGEFAFLLFSVGIVGTGMLALPVLAGSAAYAMAGTFHWRNSLALKPKLAKRFYGIIVLSTAIGVLIGFTPIDPIKALYWSAVINGVASVPLMMLVMFMAVNVRIMGKFVISQRLRVVGWLATFVMAAAAIAMFCFI